MARSPAKFALSAGMVHIDEGADETPFDVHVELLCSCSPYFNSLLSNRTEKHIPSDPIYSSNDDPDVFAELLGWVYSGDTSIDLPSRNRISFLLRLWILAAKYQIVELQNHVIERTLQR
ncbi:hypothetical protein BO82DRAFT_400626 [Aspergillus uvarum CBS 121591]|uniref:BTB domain-containing protein n=1 Tax=Aspergillus uvarum CBS 121591 TaxID=1448315 RepID=A0A319DWD7_9EURO|nr:hypothetical protein BO82DRAFT_400626 [Aspergillus uvarum CBS 121591]PYH83232.1 hypothetical protein BO82DRAFT_400626 [Aspergillus uvarum CBS 121591]